MNFFKEVIASLLKQAESFSGHSSFRLADPKAVGENPIREYTLDAVPLDDDQVIVSLSQDGGEKAFEKTLSSDEAKHIFTLISSDLAEAVSLTSEQKYDAAKAAVAKVLKNYAETTDTPVDTNLPTLHNTQASQIPVCPECGGSSRVTVPDANMDDALLRCNKCNFTFNGSDSKTASQDNKIWREAKITMQNLWFSNTDELLEYQQKQKGATSNQDHIPLWDAEKGKAPVKDSLAPASLSYEDAEKQKEKQHEDMQEHIDEKIKTELESALQQKAASVFGPDQVELVQVLRKNGRNWDEIKKILVKDFGFDKDSTNIFVDEQRQGADPTGIEVEPVKEDVDVDVKEKSPLTPPEELVSPDTHDKLLKDHEDKKKDKSVEPAIEEESSQKDLDKYTRVCPTCRSLVLPEEMRDKTTCNLCHKDASFTPQDVMAISELDEIARADNDEIHKAASKNCACGHDDLDHKMGPGNGKLPDDCEKCKCKKFHKKASLKIEAIDDLNPLQEPIQTEPTTSAPSQQDAVPMGKSKDHDAPQKGDRVFVSSDLSGEKAGFEGTFISSYKSKGTEFSIVETDQGDLLDIESHRVIKTSEGTSGAQDVEPVMEPEIAGMPDNDEIPVTPKMSDFHSAQDSALALKADVDALLKIMKEAESSVVMPMMYGIDDDSILQYANGSIYANKIKSGEMTDEDWQALIRETGRWMTQVGRQKVSQTFSQDAEWKLDQEQIGKLKTMFNVLPKDSSLHTEASAQDNPPTMYCGTCKKDTQFGSEWKGETLFQTCKTCGKETGRLKGSEKDTKKEYKPCPNCGALSSSADICLSCLKSMKQASDFEKGISQNKTADEPETAPKTQYKDYKITPKFVPKEQAIPATPELDAVLAKMDSLQQNLATLEAARKQIQAKLQEEMNKVDQSGGRVEMEAELQQSIEKAAVLIDAVESKVVQWKDKLYTLQTEEVSYVPKLTPKEMLSKIYAKFNGAEKYVQDVLNGMLAQGKNVLEKTLIQWPNKKSSVNKEASMLDEINHINDELMAALKELSSPL